MKKVLLLVLLFVMAVYPQIWKGVAINPPYRLNKVINPFSGGMYFAVGDGASIFSSTDKGLEWSIIRSGINGDVLNSAAGVLNTIYAVGNDGLILKGTSVSGSYVFNPVQGNTTSNLNEVYFIPNTEIGYIVGENSTMLKTTNAGLTWTAVNFNQNNYMFTSVTFATASIGAAVTAGGTGTVLVTENGGAGWFPLTVPNIGNIFSVAMPPESNSDVIYASGETGVIKSTNRGLTWQNITSRLPGYVYGAEIQTPAKNTVLVLTNSGVMYFSFDGGNSFTGEFAFNVVTGTAYSFYTSDTKNITVVGSNNNGGIYSVWNRTPQNILTVQNTSVYIGDTAKVPLTLQLVSGEEFYSIQSYFTGYNNKMQFIGTSTGPNGSSLLNSGWTIFANEVNPVLRLIGFGSSTIPDPGYLVYLNFKAPQNITGFRDTVIIKIDSAFINTNNIPLILQHGKVIIKRANPGDVDLNGLVQAFDASLILRYLANTVLLDPDQKRNAEVTNDNTITALDASTIGRYLAGLVPSLPWSGTGATGSPVMNDIAGVPGSIVSVPVYLSNATGVFSFEGSLSYDISQFDFVGLTFSSGFTGSMSEFGTANGVVSFAFAALEDRAVPANEPVAVLKLRIKENTPINSNPVIQLSSFRLNQNPLLANGAQTVIHIVTGIQENNGNPRTFVLSPNYPNPFNPATRISFSVPGKTMVSLVVYDLQGKEVALLMNEEKAAGNYSLAFDASKLTSGTYVYRITTAFGSFSRKMILMK